MDQFEAEMETLNCGGKKKKGRNEDNARVEECQVSISTYTSKRDSLGI